MTQSINDFQVPTNIKYGNMKSLPGKTTVKFAGIFPLIMIDTNDQGGRLPFGFNWEDNGKLNMAISLSELTENKLRMLQDVILNDAIRNRATWFGANASEQDVRSGFRPLLKDRREKSEEPGSYWPANLNLKVMTQDSKVSGSRSQNLEVSRNVRLIDSFRKPLQVMQNTVDSAYRNSNYETAVFKVGGVYFAPDRGEIKWGISKNLLALKLAPDSETVYNFMTESKWAIQKPATSRLAEDSYGGDRDQPIFNDLPKSVPTTTVYKAGWCGTQR